MTFREWLNESKKNFKKIDFKDGTSGYKYIDGDLKALFYADDYNLVFGIISGSVDVEYREPNLDDLKNKIADKLPQFNFILDLIDSKKVKIVKDSLKNHKSKQQDVYFKDLVKYILSLIPNNLEAGKNAVVQYSKDYGSWRFEASLKKDIYVETSWSHQQDYFKITFNNIDKQAKRFLDNAYYIDDDLILKSPDSLRLRKSKYADRLREELDDSISRTDKTISWWK